jgi:hypothetical protein
LLTTHHRNNTTDTTAYRQYLKALQIGTLAALDLIPLGGTAKGDVLAFQISSIFQFRKVMRSSGSGLGISPSYFNGGCFQP